MTFKQLLMKVEENQMSNREPCRMPLRRIEAKRRSLIQQADVREEARTIAEVILYFNYCYSQLVTTAKVRVELIKVTHSSILIGILPTVSLKSEKRVSSIKFMNVGYYQNNMFWRTFR